MCSVNITTIILKKHINIILHTCHTRKSFNFQNEKKNIIQHILKSNDELIKCVNTLFTKTLWTSHSKNCIHFLTSFRKTWSKSIRRILKKTSLYCKITTKKTVLRGTYTSWMFKKSWQEYLILFRFMNHTKWHLSKHSLRITIYCSKILQT